MCNELSYYELGCLYQLLLLGRIDLYTCLPALRMWTVDWVENLKANHYQRQQIIKSWVSLYL